MVALYEFLITRLYGRASRAGLKSKRFQRLGLKRFQLARPRAVRFALATDHAERIAHAVVVTGSARALLRVVGRGARMTVDAELPGRPVARHSFLLVARDFAVGQPREGIETFVV